MLALNALSRCKHRVRNYYGYYFNVWILTLNNIYIYIYIYIYKLVDYKCYPDYYHANLEENQTSKNQSHF